MSWTAALGIVADGVSAAVCFAAPFVFARILSERAFTAHRSLMGSLAVTATLRGALHLVLVANAFTPMPSLLVWCKVLSALSLVAVAVIVARRVTVFFRMVDAVQTERDYVAVVGILKRLRAQARRHNGHS